MDRNFGSVTKIAAVKKVALDQLLFAPLFVATFLTILGTTQRKSSREIKNQFEKDYVDIILSHWMVSSVTILLIVPLLYFAT